MIPLFPDSFAFRADGRIYPIRRTRRLIETVQAVAAITIFIAMASVFVGILLHRWGVL
jgi:hypothetical protein